MNSSARRNGGGKACALPVRTPSNRLHGRITKEHIRSAGLRRWDGMARITTDWFNVFHEPELWFTDGDVLIYLREPGQSSRGPTFRVHKKQLKVKGFGAILTKCIERPTIPSAANCMAVACPGCQRAHPVSELYIPAPPTNDIDVVFDHHITTRNFLAWLYDLPLAGRALGVSLVALKGRIDFYRPGTESRTGLEVISFAEARGYLDFRECLDHALAALLLAEALQLEDLWVDAFAHCVGMSHRGIITSVEYSGLSDETQLAIRQSRAEMDRRLERTRIAFNDFFEHTMSENVLGLPEAARTHFDRFRSWLHGFYIEQYGFWPPMGFDDDAVQRRIFVSMYSDFRNLYHHLADSNASGEEVSLSGIGGVCTLQNVQAFDRKYRYDGLPTPLPLIPIEPDTSARPYGLHRRKSWNPITKRKLEKDTRNSLRVQALISASNRDWKVMECLLVRRYSEFEVNSIIDDLESVSMVDGRKIRWILVYAVLQMLISVMQAPSQVRNTDGLTYSLCCRAPKETPWHSLAEPDPAPSPENRMSLIEPDADPLKTSAATSETIAPVVSSSKRDRRMSLPSRLSSTSIRNSLASTTSNRTVSIRRLMSNRTLNVPEVPDVTRTSAYCEILVQGYGNGLNEANVLPSPTSDKSTISDSLPGESSGDDRATPKASSTSVDLVKEPKNNSQASLGTDQVPELSPASSTSVSRESSNASNRESAYSKIQGDADDLASTDAISSNPLPTTVVAQSVSKPTLQELLAATRTGKEGRYRDPEASENLAGPYHDGATSLEGHQRVESKDLNKILDEQGHTRTVHINTSAWDEFLGIV